MVDAFFGIDGAAKRRAVQSDVVVAGEWAFISGLGPFDLRDDRVPLPEYVEAQTAKIFANLDELLAATGSSKDHIVSVRISLIDYARLFERMNAAYVGYFDPNRLPARSCVGVSALTRGASIEMDFVLRRPAP
jgi:2-iminobutanoate/2-iminopropanoate deaminase